CRHGAGQFDVAVLEAPHVPGEPDRDPAVADGDQRMGLFRKHAGDPGRHPRRILHRRDLEGGRGATMQDDPVIEALCDEELPPTLLAHPPEPTPRLRMERSRVDPPSLISPPWRRSPPGTGPGSPMSGGV